jgi:hypothetical protein
MHVADALGFPIYHARSLHKAASQLPAQRIKLVMLSLHKATQVLVVTSSNGQIGFGKLRMKFSDVLQRWLASWPASF